jgi:hypothetical protein
MNYRSSLEEGDVQLLPLVAVILNARFRGFAAPKAADGAYRDARPQ